MKRLLYILLLALLPLAAMAQQDLAIVNEVHGVKVFSDCTPVAEYEVLGEVMISDRGGAYAMVIGGVAVAGVQTIQYNDLRDGLVTNAIMANRDVQGVILHMNNHTPSFATMIRFKEGAEHTSQAKVNRYNGYYVFTDCTPVGHYEVKKKVSCLFTEGYSDIRDRLIRNARKAGNGLIIHFVTGGSDNAEVIILK